MDIEKTELELLEMAKFVKESLHFAFSFYFDKNLNKENFIDDAKVNAYERKIEEECLLSILKERPFATDLRKLTGYFKVVEDLERLGDHAEDIAWCTYSLAKFRENIRIPKLDFMINECLKMVDNSIDALIKGDVALANQVIANDDLIDTTYLDILNLLPELKKDKNLDDEFIIFYTLLNKYVERIADHASNVAEWAIYIKSGFYKDRNII